MKKRRPAPVHIETAGSVFFDLFEHAKAERLTIQTDLALALEREIAARKLTQAAGRARTRDYAAPRQRSPAPATEALQHRRARRVSESPWRPSAD